MKKLITFSPEERRQAAEWFNDPQGAQAGEDRANYDARHEIQRMAYLCDLASQHPDDEDCARLIQAVDALVKRKGTR